MSKTNPARFPEDHHCETLRGVTIPRPHDVRRALARRCGWLMERIQAVAMASGGMVRNSPLVDELAATVVAMEAYDAAVKARRATEADEAD